MIVVADPKEMTSMALAERQEGKTVGCVPTMGALHEGHLSLVRAARRDCDIVIVTIFVNPTQFGPSEDINEYPKPFDDDVAACEEEGVDYVFAPPVDAMYPEGSTTWVNVEGLTERLCGASRPGHFRGVTTVVAKLFNITQPDRAYFGEKDYQQMVVLKQMVADLDFPVEIVAMPIVREPDGLALSSRNKYLSREERNDALALRKSLDLATSLFEAGERSAKTIVDEMTTKIESASTARVDYVSIVDAATLEAVDRIGNSVLVAVAVYVGATRLIDNTVLNV
jgi:pantoate--beta-alanine ligase